MAEMRFAKTHEWVRYEGKVGVIGITEYAQSQLGDIVFVELPKAGEVITQAARLGTVESTKTASEIYAPVSGEVIATNDELIDNPQWINESAFEKGWMIKIKLTDPVQIGALLDEAAYKAFVAQEAH